MNNSDSWNARIQRRTFLVLGTAGLAVAGCALSVAPDKLGAACADRERRQQAAEGRSRLIARVTNVAVGKGSVHLGLYDAETPFPAEDAHLTSTVLPSDGTTVVGVFTSVPRGPHAVAAFHDLNGDGTIGTVLGIPWEPVGFSNGASVGLTGVPSFERVSFLVDRPDVTQSIPL